MVSADASECVEAWIVRHGERVDEVPGVRWDKCGKTNPQWFDPALTGRGHEHAAGVADAIRDKFGVECPFDVIYTSPLVRTVQTAEKFSEVPAAPVAPPCVRAQASHGRGGPWGARLPRAVLRLPRTAMRRRSPTGRAAASPCADPRGGARQCGGTCRRRALPQPSACSWGLAPVARARMTDPAAWRGSDWAFRSKWCRACALVRQPSSARASCSEKAGSGCRRVGCPCKRRSRCAPAGASCADAPCAPAPAPSCLCPPPAATPQIVLR